MMRMTLGKKKNIYIKLTLVFVQPVEEAQVSANDEGHLGEKYIKI